MSSSYSVLRQELNTLLALSYSKQAVPSGSQNLQQTLAIGNTAANSLFLTSGLSKSIVSRPSVPSQTLKNGFNVATLGESKLNFSDGTNNAAFDLIEGIQASLADGTAFVLSNANTQTYDYPALSFNYLDQYVGSFAPVGAYACNVASGNITQLDPNNGISVGTDAVVDPITKQVSGINFRTIMNATSFNFNSAACGLYKVAGDLQLANTLGNLDLSFLTLTFNGVPFNPTGSFLHGSIAMPGYGGTYLFATGGFAFSSAPTVVATVDCGTEPLIVCNVFNVTATQFEYALSNFGASALNFIVM